MTEVICGSSTAAGGDGRQDAVRQARPHARRGERALKIELTNRQTPGGTGAIAVAADPVRD
jgi:aspartate/tyrosine/aromatic aminotransferase